MVCTKRGLQEGGVLHAETISAMREPMLVKFEQCILSGNKASNVRPWSEAKPLLLCVEGL